MLGAEPGKWREKSGAKGSNASLMYLFVTRKFKQTWGSSHAIIFSVLPGGAAQLFPSMHSKVPACPLNTCFS